MPGDLILELSDAQLKANDSAHRRSRSAVSSMTRSAISAIECCPRSASRRLRSTAR